MNKLSRTSLYKCIAKLAKLSYIAAQANLCNTHYFRFGSTAILFAATLITATTHAEPADELNIHQINREKKEDNIHGLDRNKKVDFGTPAKPQRNKKYYERILPITASSPELKPPARLQAPEARIPEREELPIPEFQPVIRAKPDAQSFIKPIASKPEVESKAKIEPQPQAVAQEPVPEQHIGELPAEEAVPLFPTQDDGKAPKLEYDQVTKGQKITTLSDDIEIYDLKDNKPVNVRKVPAGTQFTVMKPNSNDSRIRINGENRDVFIKKSQVTTLLQEMSLQTKPTKVKAPIKTANITTETSDKPEKQEATVEKKQEDTQNTDVADTDTDNEVESWVSQSEEAGDEEEKDKGQEGGLSCERGECNKSKSKGDGTVYLFDVVKKGVGKITGDGFIRPISKKFPKSSNYGMRKHPLLGYKKMHWGIDFSAPTGTPILAPDDGVVEFAARSGGAGNMTEIRHPDGYKTIFMHQSKFAVKPGDKVKKGQVIGYVGSTGRSTGPHLHLEVQKYTKKQITKKIVKNGKKTYVKKTVEYWDRINPAKVIP